MNKQITKSHIIIFLCVAIVAMLTIFVAYPKYQDYKNQQLLKQFLGVES